MTTLKPNSRRYLYLAGGCAAAVIAVPLVFGIAGAGEDENAHNRREIARMTPAQRSRLDENFRVFLAMPEQQRDRYRELHGEIEAAPDSAQLRRTLAEYERWLTTLSPFQRQQLRETDDLDARLQLARQFQANQAAQSPSLQDLAGDFPPAQSMPELESMPPLEETELTAMIEAAAEHLSISKAELRDMPPLRRNLYVLNRAIHQGDIHQGERERRGRGDFFRWLDDELMKTMLDALPGGGFRKAINLLGIKEIRKRTLGAGILDAVRRQIQEEVRRRTSNEEMQRLWNRLDPRERRYVEQLDPDEKRRWFFRHQMEQVSQDLPELREVMRRMFLARGGPRRGDGRPDRRDDRQRGPGFRSRGENGPPTDRNPD